MYKHIYPLGTKLVNHKGMRLELFWWQVPFRALEFICTNATAANGGIAQIRFRLTGVDLNALSISLTFHPVNYYFDS